MSDNRRKKPIGLSKLAEKDFDTPIERILKRPKRLFASLLAQRELKNPEERSMEVEDMLVYVSDSYEVGES